MPEEWTENRMEKVRDISEKTVRSVMIFSGGTIDRETAMKTYRDISPDYVIAADRGILFCRTAGIVPDRIVGDFDSLGEALQKDSEAKEVSEVLDSYRGLGVPVDTYNPVKDSTDTDIALEKAVVSGADTVYFLGATGTRLDHTLSNIFDLYRLREQKITGVIIDAHNRITMPAACEMRIRKDEQYGCRLSLFPVRGAVSGLTITGVKYPEENVTLVQGDGGWFVSNEITGEECVIRWESGALLVMETKD
ncbi:MAG: thiamine diphosphokinase [Eubacteriales bacterium]|jgi:thiamine pyrophosphokinase